MTAASLEGNADNLTDASLTPYEAALSYAALGLHVVPITPGEKYPRGIDNWPNLATVDVDTIRQWWTVNYKGYGVGIAPKELPDGGWLVVIDVDEHDPAHSGEELLAELEEAYSPLPSTWTVLSGGGGRHLLFRSPVKLTNKKTKAVGEGIDVRGVGGQSVAPPTIHKDTGRPYVWDIELNPDTIPLADAPGWLIGILLPEAPDAQPTSTRHDPGDLTLPGNRYNAGTTWRELLEPDGWTFAKRYPNGVEAWTRPGKAVRDGFSATIGHKGNDRLHVFTTSVDFLENDKSFSRWAYMTYRDYGGDFSASAKAINNDPRFTPQVDDYLDELDNTPAKSGDENLHHPIQQATAEKDDENLHQPIERAKTERPTLPDDFWTARPVLQHIQQAARSRLVQPVAVLGHVLARVAAYTPPSYCCPGFIGGKVPLSLYFAFVGDSGAGKSAPVRVIYDLLPNLPDEIPLGSGEGVVESFLERSTETVNGKKKNTAKQVRHGLVFSLDEGSVLAEMSSRSGVTILPKLCQAWTGSAMGEANAGQDTRRLLPACNYHLGLTFNYQPTKIRALMDDVERGLPQRFVFLETVDPDAPDIDPDWPGELDWKPLPLIAIDGKVKHHPLTYPDHVEKLVKWEHKQKNRGKLKVALLDAHRNLQRMKLAAVLALLDGNRTTVDDLDWHLAGQLLDYSDAVRKQILDTLRNDDKQKETAATFRAIQRTAALHGAEEKRALNGAIRSIVNKLEKEKQALNRRELSRAISGKHRQLFGLDAIFDEALNRDEIEKDGDNYRRPKGRR